MNLLREIRLKNKLTQQELAAKSGIAQGVISDIESGATQNPRFDTVIKLAKALGCSVADFGDRSSIFQQCIPKIIRIRNLSDNRTIPRVEYWDTLSFF